MFELETARLCLVETPLHVVEKRIEQETFDAEINIGSQMRAIHFPPEWPGVRLGFFPQMADHLRRHPDAETWDGTLIEKAGWVAVGQMGCKGPPDGAGTVEIGYGLTPSYQGRGYMTEAVQTFAAWLLAQPGVRRVTAECLTTNTGSVRVLEKSGFARVGERHDAEEGGWLVLWQLLG